MIKFSCGFNPLRQAYQIGFGLVDENLKYLITDNKPIRIESEELNLPAPGCKFIIMGGRNKEVIVERLTEMTEAMFKDRPADEKPKQITVIDVDKSFFVAPFSSATSGRMLYIICLHEKSCEILRQRKSLMFRTRVLKGEVTPVELMILWGPSQDIMEEEFAKAKHGV